jgi:hypothetical protein
MNKPAERAIHKPQTSLISHRPQRPVEGASAAPTFNDAESPLAWLRTRRGRDGLPLISEVQYLAGERLRMEFERSMLARRTTTNWDTAGTGGRGGNVAAEMSDGAIAARQRYHTAMEEVGWSRRSASSTCRSAAARRCWAWRLQPWLATMDC